MTLGDIVTVTVGSRTHIGKPHVVVATRPGRVLFVYCGSRRWYLPAWFKVEQVTPVADTTWTKRCKRLMLAIEPSPDGWKRINVGRYGYGCEHAPVIVGHVDVPWTWTT